MTNLKNVLLLGGLSMAVAGTGLTGCSTMKEREARQTGRSVAQVITDDSTDGRVKDALHNSPVYKFKDVGVNTFNGVVQLTGFVNSSQQKRAAEDIARSVPGVQRVANDIQVMSEVAPTGRADGVYRAPIYNAQQPPYQQPQPFKEGAPNTQNQQNYQTAPNNNQNQNNQNYQTDQNQNPNTQPR